jgi:predicted DsbA family dithiol-disulfide isomerase
MIDNMKEIGEEVGISFSYGGSIGNSFDSHRLIWKAREEGGSKLQNQMVDAIFQAYFEEEKSLGVTSVLVDCAKNAGMEPSVVSDLLSPQGISIGRNEVEQELREFAMKWNCSGVPLFIVGGKYPLSGAQPVAAFEKVFEKIVADEK